MNPYQMKANPATDLPYESVMGLVVGNIGLDFQHTTLRYNNLFDFDAEGRPATVDLKKFANGLKKNNFMGLDANVDLFTLNIHADCRAATHILDKYGIPYVLRENSSSP